MFHNVSKIVMHNYIRGRLEMYEQSCAVDSVTKKCAGPASECRVAMLGILGTELRTTCACKSADPAQLFECLGWQRLLWINPCVGKYTKIYKHFKKNINIFKFDILYTSGIPKRVPYSTIRRSGTLDDEYYYDVNDCTRNNNRAFSNNCSGHRENYSYYRTSGILQLLTCVHLHNFGIYFFICILACKI